MLAETTELAKRCQRVLSAAAVAYRSRDHWDIREAELLEIGTIYKRILHYREAPRVAQTLSDSWDRGTAERTYLDQQLGLVVVDDFLSPDALESLRNFCLESTIRFANRYGYGRLGASFRRGCNCPLLVQLAEELAAAFPVLIGDRHPLLRAGRQERRPAANHVGPRRFRGGECELLDYAGRGEPRPVIRRDDHL